MQRTLYTLLSIVWGLWFGGLILLFMAVQSLFTTFAEQREIAGQGAQHIFQLFDKYQLALAAIALLLTFGWRIASPRTGKTTLFIGFAIATIGAVAIAMFISPKIVSLQGQGLTHTPQFRKMHGLSMAVYLAETIVLFFTGLWIHIRREWEAY